MPTDSELKAACYKITELSAEISDVLLGGAPGDTLTYRGTLLFELLEAAVQLKKAHLAQRADDDTNPTIEWMASLTKSHHHYVAESEYIDTWSFGLTTSGRPITVEFRRGFNPACWDVLVGGDCIAEVYTRGQLRQLLSALGLHWEGDAR